MSAELPMAERKPRKPEKVLYRCPSCHLWHSPGIAESNHMDCRRCGSPLADMERF